MKLNYDNFALRFLRPAVFNSYGVRDINVTAKVRVKHIYAVLEKENYTGTEYEEIVGFKLLSLI